MTNTDEGHDEIEPAEDDATMGASGADVDAIRAEAARIREAGGGFNPEDPTTVMTAGDLAAEPLGVEPTVTRTFDPATDVTVITDFSNPDDDQEAPVAGGDAVDARDALHDREPVARFDADADPTTVMTPESVGAGGTATASPAVAATSGASLIEGKTPPASEANYWQGGQIAEAASPAATKGKGPIPAWFIATSLLAVLLAVGLVVLVLWALSGSTV